MPTYEFRCTACGREFSRTMTIREYGGFKPRCPKCRSTRVERVLSPFFAKTSRKS